jgi:NAD(P)-dependent dehydrogenase (short-subunit alcohol dehydrogenase family)
MQTNSVGPLNVTCAVLPTPRAQYGGHINPVDSGARLVGVNFCSAYAASKVALEGRMETLQLDVEPFGIRTTIIRPGFFCAELLDEGAPALLEISAPPVSVTLPG